MNAFTEAKAGSARAAQKASTRARILDVARAQLDERGFEGTSIRDVAKQAGVAAGTVLLHFPDKQELLHAALFDDLEATWAAARALPERRSLLADLTSLAEAFFAFYARRPRVSRALLRESLFAAPPWNQRFAAQVGEVHVHVATLAREAQARGELDASLDVALLGAAFFSFYYFALLAWLQGGHDDPSRLFRRMLEQHLRLPAATDENGPKTRAPAVSRAPRSPSVPRPRSKKRSKP